MIKDYKEKEKHNKNLTLLGRAEGSISSVNTWLSRGGLKSKVQMVEGEALHSARHSPTPLTIRGLVLM